MQRGLGITWECNVGNVFFFYLWLKEEEEKKQLEETRKQHHVFKTGNSLFKGFTTECVRNYDLKLFGKLDSGVAWNFSAAEDSWPVDP